MNNKHSAFVRPAIFALTVLMAAQAAPVTASWTAPFTALVRPAFWAAAVTKIVDGLRSLPTSRWIIIGLSATTALATWGLWHYRKNCNFAESGLAELNAQHEEDVEQARRSHATSEALERQIAALRGTLRIASEKRMADLNGQHEFDQAQINRANQEHQAAITALNNQLNALREALRIAQNPQPAAPVAPAQPAVVPARPASAPAVVAQPDQQPAPQSAPVHGSYLDASNISRVSHM